MWWFWIALLDQNKLALQLLIHLPPWIKNITRNKEDMSKVNALFKTPLSHEPDPLSGLGYMTALHNYYPSVHLSVQHSQLECTSKHANYV